MIKQIIYELRQHSLMTWVTVCGTALSIFLLMAVYMVNRVDSVSVPPETHRERMMYGRYGHVWFEESDNHASGDISSETAHRLYDDIKGVEMISLFSSWNEPVDVNLPGKFPLNVESKKVDDVFWKMFDFDFTGGTPFTKGEVESNAKVTVLSESLARTVFGSTDAVGRDIWVNHIPHRVIGVVKDVNPILSSSASQIYMPWKETPDKIWETYLGQTGVYLLLSEGTDPDDVKREVKRRYDVMNASLAKEGKSFIYHGAPFTPEENRIALGSNTEPDTEQTRKMRYLLYLILLIIPAINLSGMSRSRLKQRVSEIGIRRAFGATRFRIAWMFICENFLLTLVGGVIGLALCVIFILFLSNMFVNYFSWFSEGSGTLSARPSFTMLFTWGTFGMVLLFSFVLNLLSTGIPAFRASRVNPAEAISGHES